MFEKLNLSQPKEPDNNNVKMTWQISNVPPRCLIFNLVGLRVGEKQKKMKTVASMLL